MLKEWDGSAGYATCSVEGVLGNSFTPCTTTSTAILLSRLKISVITQIARR